MKTYFLRAAAVAAVSCVVGCATYTSPFVHKTEEELDAMETLSEEAAQSFAAGDYAESDRVLSSLASEQTVSRPLYELERVSVLLHQGKKQEAHALMLKIRKDFDMLFDAKSEEEAMSLWHGENKKVFKGDVHERATFYALLALSFMDLGEWDDAERCVKNGLLADSANTEEVQYNSDYALLQYLGYVACRRGGREADAADYKRELQQILGDRAVQTGKLLDESPLPNAFLVVWAGKPPTYVRGGAYNEVRHVIPGAKSPFSCFSVRADGLQERLFPAGLADVNFQATTRGGREMDSVLSDKAAVKSGMKASGNILLILGMGCFACMGNNSQADLVLLCAGTGCVVMGGVFHIVGHCINSSADIRSWKTLPGEFFVLPLNLPEGKRELEVCGYHLRDEMARRGVSVDVSSETISTVHLSMLKYQDLLSPSAALIDAGVAVETAADGPLSRDIKAEILTLNGGAK